MSDYDDSPLEYSDDDEYNSEDDEFLAFHDAEIEAQVRAEMEKMKERVVEAQEWNKKLISMTDQDRKAQWIADQVKLLGTEKLYRRIDRNLKEYRFEAYFAQVCLLCT